MTYKTIVNARKKSTNYITLSNLISNRFYHTSKGWTALHITDSINIDGLVALIGGRGHNYKRLLSDYISYGRDYGILERVIFNNGKWSYIAGQDYTSEMNTIRKILRDGE